MALKGLTGGLYQPLSSADIETIHQASLTILENTGISYESGLEETIDMLWKHKGPRRTERFAMIGSRLARKMPPHGHGRLPEQFWRKKKIPTSPLMSHRPSVGNTILSMKLKYFDFKLSPFIHRKGAKNAKG